MRAVLVSARWATLAAVVALTASNANADVKVSFTCTTTSATSPVDAPCALKDEYGESFATGIATQTVLKGYASASGTANTFSSPGGGVELAAYDRVTLRSLGLEGLMGEYTIQFYPTWTLKALAGDPQRTLAGAYAQFDFTARGFLSTTPSIVGSGMRYESYSVGYQSAYQSGGFNGQTAVSLGAPMIITLNAPFGDPFDIEMLLRISAGAVRQGAAEVAANNSVYWGGITKVTYQGRDVDYTVESLSGTDYRTSALPVPEASTLALMLAGLMLVFVFGYRKLK